MIQNMQIPQEQLTDEDFDFKGTSRKEYEHALYKHQCSEILDGFLFLAGDLVARNEQQLKEAGITHVINCAADYSEDYFKDKGIKYKSYHLKDHVHEDIACIFYDAIDFIQSAKSAGGRVLVHCVQGISRSATVVIAYIIFSTKMNSTDAFNLCRNRRPCTNPNMAFIAQLN